MIKAPAVGSGQPEEIAVVGVACLFPGEGYDRVLARAFGLLTSIATL